MSKRGRTKPIRRKGQTKRWAIRAFQTTGPTLKSMSAVNPVLLAEYSARSRNLGKDMRYLDAMFPGAGGEGKNVPRLEALRRKAQMIAEEKAGKPDACINMYTDKMKRIVLYFNETRTRWFFVKEEYQLSLIQTSIEYSSFEAAKMIFMNGSVQWLTAELITSTSS